MLNNQPNTFAFVQIHHGDAFATTWGNARGSFYTDFAAYPTSYFDGTLRREGAFGYATYLADYNTRRAVATDVTISMTGAQVVGQTYKAQARVCIEPGGTAKTMRIYMVQVLDYWPTVVTYSRNGFKQAATTVDITLSPGECQTIERNFTFDADSWGHQNDITIIAWAQEAQSSSPPSNRAEVYQAAIMNWPFPVGDCNSNGIADDEDIAQGTSLDCNLSSVPDECELLNNDCNTNSIPDDCDISTGSSVDCDANGDPDECQPDCNANGVADTCDIAQGSSADCQPDGVPDDCQVAGNDCNTNSVPDDCDVTPKQLVQIIFNLDTDPGWTTQPQWAFGVPLGLGSHSKDPSAGYTGTNVYGYNLIGDYANNMPQALYLTTTAIDCSLLTGTQLQFRRRLGVEGTDRATIQASRDGVNWTLIWQNPTGSSISEGIWSLQSYDISAVADGAPTLYLRWGMGPTDASTTYPGWNLDDIEVRGLIPASWDCNANGKPDECDDQTGGDYDANGIVDLADYAVFESCFLGPAVAPGQTGPGCFTTCLDAFDADADNDVDLVDFAGFAASAGAY